MRAPSAAGSGRACAVRTPASALRTRSCRSRVAARAEQGGNPFAKIGTQLIKAGSSLTSVLSGTAKVQKRGGPANEGTVFVAGATGRLGSRIVKQALEAGYTVRAACRSEEKGQALLAKGKKDGLFSQADLRRIKLVQFDVSDPSSFEPAIGNAGVVVSALGAPESKPFDVSGPKKVDGEGSVALVKAARDAGVKRFVLVTSLGTTKFGWPASALNLFWGVLFWKAQAEDALIKSGMVYTIVRPGGMERPQDDYKETHSTVLYPRDTQFGGQVSRLQVAEVVAACLSDTEASGNKTLEVVAEEGAPEPDFDAMLAEIEPEISIEEMREKQVAIADLRNREQQLVAEAESLEEDLAAAEEQKVLAEQAYSEAREQLGDVRSESRDAIREAEQGEANIEALEEQLEEARRQEAAAKAVLDAQRTAGRDGEVLSGRELKEIRQSVLSPGSARGGRGGGGLLGGLFGGAAKAAVDDVEEEVEEAAEEVQRRAKPAFGGFFGGAKNQVEEVAEEVEEEAEEVAEEVQKRAKPAFGGFFGGAKKQVEEVAEEVEEEVEEAVEEVQTRAKPAFGGFFGGAKKQAQEVAEEVEEEAQEAVAAVQKQAPKKGGLGALFGGAKKQAQQVAEEVEEQVEEAAPAVQRTARRGAKQAQAQVEEAVEEVQEEVKKETSKGGGLFGLFQQDTVFADSGAGDAAPPSEEQVERAVTKRGRGPPKRRVQEEAEEVADSVAEGADKAKEEASQKAQEAKQAVSEEAPQATKQVEKAGGFLGGLFGGAAKQASQAVDDVSKQASQAADTTSKAVEDTSKKVAATAKKAAPSRGDGASDDPALAEKRAAAVASALKNLGKAVEDKGGDAAEAVESGVKSGAKQVGEEAKAAALSVADKAEAGVADAQEAARQNGAPVTADAAAAEARAWIDKWRKGAKSAVK